MASDHQHSNKKDPHQEMSSDSKPLDEQKNLSAEENAKSSSSQGTPLPPPKTITITDVELGKLKKDLQECQDKYLRSLAESENARKRLQKEKQEMIQYATQNIIVDFLHPIDHMENALKFTQQMSDEVKHWAAGFQMILAQFKDILASNGVKPFVSEGQPFDPHRHEAIESVATEGFPPGIVIEESLRGYSMGDKIIRPSRVKVSKAPSAIASKEKNESKEEEN